MFDQQKLVMYQAGPKPFLPILYVSPKAKPAPLTGAQINESDVPIDIEYCIENV